MEKIHSTNGVDVYVSVSKKDAQIFSASYIIVDTNEDGGATLLQVTQDNASGEYVVRMDYRNGAGNEDAVIGVQTRELAQRYVFAYAMLKAEWYAKEAYRNNIDLRWLGNATEHRR